MQTRGLPMSIGALVLLATSFVEAQHSHGHHEILFRRHGWHHGHREQPRSLLESGASGLALRAAKNKAEPGKCQFPDDAGLVAVAPDKENAGWAMSPDQPCLPDNYCPYACPPGQVSMQWDPTATTYSYPKSMNGGLYCDEDGKISKPFPNKPYCEDAKAGIGALNKAGDTVCFCQTVLPGNEAMLIPTSVNDSAELAVPGTDYWAGTAAHYYINPPGVSEEDACIWGTKENPVGNWSPYVAGANTDKNGQTFIKLGWNPIYLEPETPFRDDMPEWGVKIECDGEGCVGLPCEIDPSEHKVNEVAGSTTTGAGGASFCVVGVPEKVNANFVVFDRSGGSESQAPSKDESSSEDKSSSPDAAPSTTLLSATSDAPQSSSPPESYSPNAVADSLLDAPVKALPAKPQNSPHQLFEVSNSTDSNPSSIIEQAASQTSSSELEQFTGAATTVQLSMLSLSMSSLIVFATDLF